MEAVKIGILGCGGIARSKHLPELQKIEGVEIIGFMIQLNPALRSALKSLEITQKFMKPPGSF